MVRIMVVEWKAKFTTPLPLKFNFVNIKQNKT